LIQGIRQPRSQHFLVAWRSVRQNGIEHRQAEGWREKLAEILPLLWRREHNVTWSSSAVCRSGWEAGRRQRRLSFVFTPSKQRTKRFVLSGVRITTQQLAKCQ
jgi:hypothetical protein